MGFYGDKNFTPKDGVTWGNPLFLTKCSLINMIYQFFAQTCNNLFVIQG